MSFDGNQGAAAAGAEAQNMLIWNLGCVTDKDHTTPYRKGGFNGTSLKPIAAYEKATRIFGPAGLGWKAEVIDEKIFAPEGHPLDAVHYCRVRVSWRKGAQTGSVEAFGATGIWQKRTNGPAVVVEDFAKMSMTDATLKAFSFLGIGADLHYGLHENQDYRDSTPRDKVESVEKLKKHRNAPSAPPADAGTAPASQGAAAATEGKSDGEYKAKRKAAIEAIAAEVKRMNANRELVNQYTMSVFGRELRELTLDEMRTLYKEFKKIKSIPLMPSVG